LVGKTRDILKKFETTHKFDTPVALVTGGVYTKTRNPMYLGMSLFLLGFAICFGNLFGLLTPVIFILIVNFKFIPFEEKMMEEKFGQEYINYKRNVGRWF
jgi:protein-S-isoprenylcysteine O-methyltransferase Ste14